MSTQQPKFIKFRGAWYREQDGFDIPSILSAGDHLDKASSVVSSAIVTLQQLHEKAGTSYKDDHEYQQFLFVERAIEVADEAISSVGMARRPLESLNEQYEEIMSKYQ